MRLKYCYKCISTTTCYSKLSDNFFPLSSSCLLRSCCLTNWVLTIIWRYVFHRRPISLVRTNCNAVIVDGLNCHAKWEDLCSINTYMSWLCIQIRIRMISNGTLATSRCPVRYRKHSTTCIHTLASTRTAQPASTWAVQPGSNAQYNLMEAWALWWSRLEQSFHGEGLHIRRQLGQGIQRKGI